MDDVLRLGFLALAGFIGGGVNAVAGGGSLVSYPALLLVLGDPILANVTNTTALTPGLLGGVLGYRSELVGQESRVRALLAVSLVGGVLGAFLLSISSSEFFEKLVPFLILFACALLAIQQPLSGLFARSGEAAPWTVQGHGGRTIAIQAGVFLIAVYGGYFGAGLGIVLLAALALSLSDRLQRLNALKALISLLIQIVAVVFFALFLAPDWRAVAVMTVGTVLGGYVGVRLARRLDDRVLRWVVIVFGVIVAIQLF